MEKPAAMAEAVEDLESQHAESGTKRIFKDLFGGAVGGVAQVLIGMSATRRERFHVVIGLERLPFRALELH